MGNVDEWSCISISLMNSINSSIPNLFDVIFIASGNCHTFNIYEARSIDQFVFIYLCMKNDDSIPFNLRFDFGFRKTN